MHFLERLLSKRQRIKLHKSASSRHTRVIELKVEQLTSLDNGIFTENICIFDEKKSEKGLDIIGNISSGHTRVSKLKYEN